MPGADEVAHLCSLLPRLITLWNTQIEERLERMEKQLAKSEAAMEEKIEKAKNEEVRQFPDPTNRC